MTTATRLSPAGIVVAYYGATVIFLLLDTLFGINVRLAFLQEWPGWRALYYVFCLLCFGLMIWRPAWRSWIGIAESLITLSLLIINMAARVVIVTDEMIESGRGFVTSAELVNFMIAAGIVYVGYLQQMQAVQTSSKSSIISKNH